MILKKRKKFLKKELLGLFEGTAGESPSAIITLQSQSAIGGIRHPICKKPAAACGCALMQKRNIWKDAKNCKTSCNEMHFMI